MQVEYSWVNLESCICLWKSARCEMDGGNLAGSETSLGLSVMNCVISSCTDSRQERRDVIQPCPLWPLKHPLPGAEDTPEGGQRCKTKIMKGLHPERSKCSAWKLRRNQGLIWRRTYCGIQQGRPTFNEGKLVG